MILYLREQKTLPKTTRNNKLFRQSNRMKKINIQKSVPFLYSNNKQTEKEIREMLGLETTVSESVSYPPWIALWALHPQKGYMAS
jgi:hypothetical protein